MWTAYRRAAAEKHKEEVAAAKAGAAEAANMSSAPPAQPAPNPAIVVVNQNSHDHRPLSNTKVNSRSRGSTIRVLINEFNDYGHRTTVHGLGHMYQSTDIRRKLFWLLITIVGCIACAVHVYFIIENYMETPVNSVILQGRIRLEFPDVTLCNMRPVSESVLQHATADIHEHIKRRWNYFSGFINSSKNSDSNTTLSRFRASRKFMQIFWASEDTRDLAHDDDLFLSYCSYKNKPCSNDQFKMVQNLEYWNCYTFSPESMPEGGDRLVYSSNEDDGLNLILYTNSHLLGVHPSKGTTNVTGIKRLSEENNSHAYNFLERYLEKYNLSLNQLLAGEKLEPDGMRVILHEKGTYPHMYMNSVIVGTGDYSNINFYMERKEGKNRPEHPCREHSNDDEDWIEYVSYYPGNDIRYSGKGPPPNFKKFKRGRLDYVIERSQKMFWNECQCYTHNMPYQVFNSRLCYFCKNGTDPDAISRTLENIECHDQVEEKLKSEIFTFFKESQDFQPCSVNHYDVKTGSSAWPSQRDIQFLIDQYVIPAFKDQSVGNRSYNHILQKTKVSPIHDIVELNETKSSIQWKTEEFLIRKNFLKISIHAESPTGTLHEEVQSYSFAEALSEVGGIFGLYAGVSILTFFEFVELAYIMLTKPKEVKDREHGGQTKLKMIQDAMRKDELSQYNLSNYQNAFGSRNCCSASNRFNDMIINAESESVPPVIAPDAVNANTVRVLGN